MLTAESEGGQRKCHPYWLPGDYGPMRLQAVGERSSSLDIHKPSPGFNTRSPFSRPDIGPPERPGPGRRRSTYYTSGSVSAQPASAASLISNDENPHVIIRKLTLSHAAHSSEPPREITQLQYTSWPDFGAPARPAHVLSLVEHCNEMVRGYEGGRGPDEPAGVGERPVVVHCSAGCGRTGTFCTVDSVVDMLKRQRLGRLLEGAGDPMDADKPKTKDGTGKDEAWITHDDEDLVAKTVEDFRLQRLSMVQTLRQFVLCYETVLEWFTGEMPERSLKVKDGSEIRRSYHG
ncbi:MAG: hypothetical protein LQ351_004185 [Letrouitia transgressa]|nr:MAG: hypothetical protein LQ351_004185 [Letrouitia transgressa]